VSAGDTPPGMSEVIVACRQCGVPYEQTGRGNGGWFHYMVVAMHPHPDGRIRVIGHWRAGDWIDGALLVLHRSDGRRVPITGAEMEPPLSRACEVRGQRTLIIPEISPLQPYGCIHAAR